MRIEIELRNGQKRIVEVDTDNPTQELVNQIATDIESKMGPVGGERRVRPVERGTPAARPSDPLTALAMRYRKQQTAPAPKTHAEFRKRQGIPEQNPEAAKFVDGMRPHKDASVKVLGENHPLSIVRRIREIEERISPSRFGKKGEDYPSEEELQQRVAAQGTGRKITSGKQSKDKGGILAASMLGAGPAMLAGANPPEGKQISAERDPVSMLRDYSELRDLENRLSQKTNKKFEFDSSASLMVDKGLPERVADAALGRGATPFRMVKGKVSRETQEIQKTPVAQNVEQLLEESYLTNYGRKPVPQTMKAALASFKPEPGSIREAALQGAALQAIPRLGLRMAFGEEAAEAIEQTDWFKGANEAWAIGKYFLPGVGLPALLVEQTIPFMAHTMNEGPMKATETMVVDFVKSLNVLEPGLSWQEGLGRLANIAFMVGGAKYGIARARGIAEDVGVRFDRLSKLGRIHAEWEFARTPEQKWAAAKKFSELTATYGKDSGSQSEFVAVTDAAAFLKAQEQAKKVAAERMDRSGAAAWATLADKTVGDHWTDHLGLDEGIGPIRLPATPEKPDAQKTKMTPEATREYTLIDQGLQAAFRETSARLIADGIPVEHARRMAAESVERLVSFDDPPYTPKAERSAARKRVPITFARDVVDQILETAGIPKRDAPNVLIPTNRDALTQDLVRAREELGLDYTDLDIEAMVELHVQLGVVRQSLADTLSGEDYLSLVREVELVRTPEAMDDRKPSEATRYILDQMEGRGGEMDARLRREVMAGKQPSGDMAMVDLGPETRVDGPPRNVKELLDEAQARPEALDPFSDEFDYELAGNILEASGRPRQAVSQLPDAMYELGGQRERQVEDDAADKFHSSGDAAAVAQRYRVNIIKAPKGWGSKIVSDRKGKRRTIPVAMGGSVDRALELVGYSDERTGSTTADGFEKDESRTRMAAELASYDKDGGYYVSAQDYKDLKAGRIGKVKKRTAEEVILETGTVPADVWNAWVDANSTLIAQYAYNLDLNNYEPGSIKKKIDAEAKERRGKAKADREYKAELAAIENDMRGQGLDPSPADVLAEYDKRKVQKEPKTEIAAAEDSETETGDVAMEPGSGPVPIAKPTKNFNHAAALEAMRTYEGAQIVARATMESQVAAAKAAGGEHIGAGYFAFDNALDSRSAVHQLLMEFDKAASDEVNRRGATVEVTGGLFGGPEPTTKKAPVQKKDGEFEQDTLFKEDGSGGYPYDPETGQVDLSAEIEKSQDALSSKRPNKMTAARELKRLEELGVDITSARDALDEYEGLDRSDYTGESAAEDFAMDRSAAYNGFIEALGDLDALVDHDPMLHGEIPEAKPVEDAALPPSPEESVLPVKSPAVESYERYRETQIEDLGLDIDTANRVAAAGELLDRGDMWAKMDAAVERGFHERQERGGPAAPVDAYIKKTRVELNGSVHYSISTAIQRMRRAQAAKDRKAAAAALSKDPNYISIGRAKGLLPASVRDYWNTLYQENQTYWAKLGRADARKERAQFERLVQAEIERYDGKIAWDDLVDAYQALVWEEGDGDAVATVRGVVDALRDKGQVVTLTPEQGRDLAAVLSSMSEDAAQRVAFKARHVAEFIEGKADAAGVATPKAQRSIAKKEGLAQVPPMGQKSSPDIDYRRITLQKGDGVASIVKQIAMARFAQSPARERVPLLARYGTTSQVGDAFVRYIKAGEAPIPDLEDLMGYLAERVGERIAQVEVPPGVRAMFDEWLADRKQIERSHKHGERQRKEAEEEAQRIAAEEAQRLALIEEAKKKLEQDRSVAAAMAKLDELEAAGIDVSAKRAQLEAAIAARKAAEDAAEDGQEGSDVAMVPGDPEPGDGLGDDFWNDFLSGLDDLKPIKEQDNGPSDTTGGGPGAGQGGGAGVNGGRPSDSPGISPPPSTARDADDSGQSGGPRGGNSGGPSSGRFAGAREFKHPGIYTARAEVTHRVSTARIPSRLNEFLSDDQQQGVAKAIERTLGAASPKASPDTVILVPRKKPDGTPVKDSRGYPVMEEKHINRAASRSGGFLNQDGTGVGKTRQILATAQAHLDAGHKVVVIGPKSTLGISDKWDSFTGSYFDDSSLMGVDVELWRPTRGAKPPDPKKVTLTTYDYAKDLAGLIDENTFVVFDEAHALKNAHSQRANYVMPLIDTAQSVMFATATAVDKISHLHYLQRAGILGEGEFEDMMKALGMRPAKGGMGTSGITWVPDPRISKMARLQALDNIFKSITENGASIKREIRMDGFKVNYNYVDIPPEGRDALEFIEREMTEAGDSGANIKMTLRRQLEPYKVGMAMKRMEEHLRRGRKVVIFVQRVKTSKATVSDGQGGRIPIWETDGTARMIAEELKARGIKFAEIHGEAADNAATSMNSFQAGEADVLVATLESGGTGINLDDRVGDAPRTMIVVTSPFTAVTAMQAIGRIWRMTTKSWSEAEFIVGKGIDIDKWNIDIIATKFDIMGAAVSGHATKAVHPHEVEWGDIDYVRDFDSAMPYGGDVSRVSVGAAFVQVDPLPRKPGTTYQDVRNDMERVEQIIKTKITYAPVMRGRKLGFYRPSDTGSRVRTMSLRTAFHEVFGHALDDKYGLVAKWNHKGARSPFDDELWQFGKFTSLPSYSLRQKRMEGVAEWMHAWALNPKAAEAAAPMWTKHFEKNVPADVRQAIRELGDHVREWASGESHQIQQEHINFFGRGKRNPIEAIVNLFKFHHDGLYQTPAWIQHFGQYMLDDLGAVEHGMRATLDRLALKRYGEKAEPGDALILPDDDPIAGMRQLAYSQSRLEDILANGVRDAQGNRVTGGLGWVLEPLDSTSMPALQADFKDAMTLMSAMRQVEISYHNTRKAQAAIDPIVEQIKLLNDDLKGAYANGLDDKSPEVKKLQGQLRRARAKIQKIKADLKNKDENMTGAGKGVYSDLDLSMETVSAHPGLLDAQDMVLQGGAADIFEAMDNLGMKMDPKLERHLLVAERYQRVGDALLAYMVQRGRMTSEAALKIRGENQFYQSFKRIMEDIGEDRDVSRMLPEHKGGAVARVKRVIFQRKGSTRPLDDPLVSFLTSIEAIVRETDRNAVLAQWADLLQVNRGMHDADTPPYELASIGQQMEGPGRNHVVIYRKGKKQYWKFNPAITKAITTGLGASVDSFLINLLTTFQSVARNSIIISPDFWVRNVIRDPIERVVKTETGSTLKDQFKKSTKQQLDDYAYYGGGIHEGHYLRDARSFYEVQERAMKELVSKGHIVLAPGEILNKATEFLKASERIGRMAEFRSAYRQARADGLSHQQANIFAFEKSRDLLDFAVAGSVMRVVNKIIPFTNAGVQGKRRMWKSVRNDPAGLAKRYAKYILAPTMAAYALRMAQGGDEEHAQQPDYLRDMFWHVNVFGLRLTIPRGFETALGAAMIERTLDKLRGDEKAFEGFGTTAKAQLMPFDESGILVGPGIFPGVGEAISNYDYFRGREIVPDWEDDLALHARDVSKASELGKLLQEVLQVDARKIDHWIDSQFGGLGRLAKTSSNVVSGRVETEKSRMARSLVGITAAPPASNARDVAWVSKHYKLAGMRANPLKALLDRYKKAKSDDERAVAGKRLYEAARKLRLAAEKAAARAKTDKQVTEAHRSVLSRSGYDK